MILAKKMTGDGEEAKKSPGKGLPKQNQFNIMIEKDQSTIERQIGMTTMTGIVKKCWKQSQWSLESSPEKIGVDRRLSGKWLNKKKEEKKTKEEEENEMTAKKRKFTAEEKRLKEKVV